MRYAILIFILLISISCRKDKQAAVYQKYTGQTMGTFYEYSYKNNPGLDSIQRAVDSILAVVNQAASTYIEQSVISGFNKASDSFCIDRKEKHTEHFVLLFDRSLKIGMIQR